MIDLLKDNDYEKNKIIYKYKIINNKNNDNDKKLYLKFIIKINQKFNLIINYLKMKQIKIKKKDKKLKTNDLVNYSKVIFAF